MNWTDLLKKEATSAYGATEGLLDLVDADGLDWKPATGENWMTMGQLLEHLHNACGFCCRGFATGDWGMPEGVEMGDMKPEDMLPTADKMPSIDSLDAAKEKLAADKALCFEMIDQVGEADLAGKVVDTPWAPGLERNLGHHFLQMIDHLRSHKGQLFYYLKLQGKPVHTGNYYGM